MPMEGYRIAGTGDGGIAGFAKGAAPVHLAEPYYEQLAETIK